MSHTIFIALRVCQMRPSGVGAEHHPDDVVVEIERVSVDHRRAFPLVHPRRQQHLRQSIRTAGGGALALSGLSRAVPLRARVILM